MSARFHADRDDGGDRLTGGHHRHQSQRGLCRHARRPPASAGVHARPGYPPRCRVHQKPRVLSNASRASAADEAISGASLWLTRDLNSAAALPAGMVRVGNPQMTLQYGSPPVIVAYSVNTNNDLVRTVNGVDTTAARGITSVTIMAAAGCYATVTIQPSATGATAATFHVGNRPGGCW